MSVWLVVICRSVEILIEIIRNSVNQYSEFGPNNSIWFQYDLIIVRQLIIAGAIRQSFIHTYRGISCDSWPHFISEQSKGQSSDIACSRSHGPARWSRMDLELSLGTFHGLLGQHLHDWAAEHVGVTPFGRGVKILQCHVVFSAFIVFLNLTL